MFTNHVMKTCFMLLINNKILNVFFLSNDFFKIMFIYHTCMDLWKTSWMNFHFFHLKKIGERKYILKIRFVKQFIVNMMISNLWHNLPLFNVVDGWQKHWIVYLKTTIHVYLENMDCIIDHMYVACIQIVWPHVEFTCLHQVPTYHALH